MRGRQARLRVWLVVLLAPAMLQAQGPGSHLYSEHCALCHGATGDGGAGPDLTSPAWHASVSDSDIDRVIAAGRRAMPRFGDTLDAPARKDLIDHLRSLQAQAIQPTTTARAPRIEVGSEALLRADENDAEWLMYGRDYGHQRRSPLKQIRKENVRNLVPAWSFQTGTPDGLEATPVLARKSICRPTSIFLVAI